MIMAQQIPIKKKSAKLTKSQKTELKQFRQMFPEASNDYLLMLLAGPAFLKERIMKSYELKQLYISQGGIVCVCGVVSQNAIVGGHSTTCSHCGQTQFLCW